jgi:hypothetical protein
MSLLKIKNAENPPTDSTAKQTQSAKIGELSNVN